MQCSAAQFVGRKMQVSFNAARSDAQVPTVDVVDSDRQNQQAESQPVQPMRARVL